MTRLRPKRSASGPANGAASAQASTSAEIVQATAASELANWTRNSGKSGWVAYMSMNALAPHEATAA